VPPNVKFEIDDANLEWTWSDNSFDFIHIRFLVGAIKDWGSLYREAFRCCKPGGWLESHEPSLQFRSGSDLITEDSPMGQWNKVFEESVKVTGRTFRLVDEDQQKKLMEEAGFVDIVVKDIQVPFGDWPKDQKKKELGMFTKVAILSDLEGKFGLISGQSLDVYGTHANGTFRIRFLHMERSHGLVPARDHGVHGPSQAPDQRPKSPSMVFASRSIWEKARDSLVARLQC
jgi:hypothetical protein